MDSQLGKSQYEKLSVSLLSIAPLLILSYVFAASSQAETLSSEALDTLQVFVNKINELGPQGQVVCILLVMALEMIPLFPTQPLSITSGLIYGTGKGCLIILSGGLLASLGAFYISRKFGKGLADKFIQLEGEGAEEGKSGGINLKNQLRGVFSAIQNGSQWQQYVSLLVVRLSPVVPYSATNYLLGLTAIKPLPYAAATGCGLLFWGFIYAGLGSTGSTLLQQGLTFNQVISNLGQQATEKSTSIGIVAIALTVIGVVFYIQQQNNSSNQYQRK